MLMALTKFRVYFAGISSLIVTVGVARFSYSLLLPIMQDGAGLTELGGGWLASTNFMGYMSGVLLAASLHNMNYKYNLHRLYLILSVLTSAAMVMTTDMVTWAVLRFIAGVCASGGFIIASGLILKWLVKHHHRAELGIHFSGAGLSIIITSLLVEFMLTISADWQQQWLALAVMAAVFAIPAWLWMPPPFIDGQVGGTAKDTPPSKVFKSLMMLAYFCAGYGYAVSSTFIVDIVERVEGLQGQGGLAFLLVGLAATPAALIWDRIARRTGYIKALIIAYILQAIGIILPAINDCLPVVILSALMFGGTFIACVSMVLTMAGKFYPSNPAKFMGTMTLAYGAAQILAPVCTGYLTETFGSYDIGLYVSAAIVMIGTLFLFGLFRIEINASEKKDTNTQTRFLIG
ncbi:MAG: YbfB/YjiJ family MFS transporter [Shewanella vesiculosa]|nr:YbfB/YjiJ family MFS transporter [Shewanella vesiculosa]NCQ46820.1 YbfB/YjiJ family MFS transporter [Shewanella frigidimarina]PIP98462.1 MAG: MFS transporter [Shewanella sp. CG18_big_fil_WC_8_21_14_2_50_42_11]PIY64593.1 MAG: MFS transporter [Shewanella sp. CG_4_10_14_0_8_um_filter_42_13]PJB93572.1 MAG: MFS transporter [Shewanella sp. CG_4_9_14_0_8_um_filter_42_14]